MYLYFSYGSNMNPNVMLRQRKSSFFVGVGKLKNYDVDFGKKYLTIEKKKNKHVYGVVWIIFDKKDIDNLNFQEEVPNLYKKIFVHVEIHSKILNCFSYQLVNGPDNSVPSLDYVKTIFKGANYYNLNQKYISSLKNKILERCLSNSSG